MPTQLTQEEPQRGARAPTAPEAPGPSRQPNGHVPGATTVEAEPGRATAPAPRQRRRRRRLLLLVPILLIVGAIGATIGYRYWYESTYFVMTDNAQVTGDMVQVGSLNAGRIVATRVDVGDQVQKDQEIAVVAVPQQVGTIPNSGAPRLQESDTTDARVPVLAPISGVIVARFGYVGGTVAAGQAIYAIVDPGQIWIRANIDETKIARVRPGQTVDVHVDALDRDFVGRVEAVTPASAATFSLLPTQNVSGNFTKVTQYVPVKISVASGGVMLPLGTSVEVRIHVEPRGWLPWQP